MCINFHLYFVTGNESLFANSFAFHGHMIILEICTWNTFTDEILTSRDINNHKKVENLLIFLVALWLWEYQDGRIIACRAGVFLRNECSFKIRSLRPLFYCPLPKNHFLARPNPLSVSLSKMAAYRIIHRSPSEIRLLCRLGESYPVKHFWNTRVCTKEWNRLWASENSGANTLSEQNNIRPLQSLFPSRSPFQPTHSRRCILPTGYQVPESS